MMGILQATISAIHTDIKAGHLDMEKELSGFCKTIKRDMREELGNFKDGVNQKLSEIGAELKNTEARMEEVENRAGEVEEWSVNTKDALLQALKEQEHIVYMFSIFCVVNCFLVCIQHLLHVCPSWVRDPSSVAHPEVSPIFPC